MERSCLQVDVGTKVELLAAVEKAVVAHMAEYSSEFEGKPSVTFTDVVDPFKVKLSVSWTYSFNGEWRLFDVAGLTVPV